MMFNIGRLLSFFFINIKYDIYFFIPHVNAGGAEQVHLTTLKALKEEGYRVATIVTATQGNELMSEFKELSTVYDIRKSNSQRALFLFYLGFWSSIINRANSSILVGSHSYFFYRLLSFIKGNKRIVDVIHSLEEGKEIRYGKLFDEVEDKITHVVCVDTKTQSLIKLLSKRKFVKCITNATAPTFFTEKRIRKNSERKAVFVGRYDQIKRPHIIEKLSENTNIQIGWIGSLPEERKVSTIIYEGLIRNREDLAKIMNQYDFLLISSKSEAFPMVIQEAMALGMIVISTNVGGISNHITHLQNGVLIESTSENEIISDFEKYIDLVSRDTQLSTEISINASDYAKKEFDYSVFKKDFLKLIQ